MVKQKLAKAWTYLDPGFWSCLMNREQASGIRMYLGTVYFRKLAWEIVDLGTMQELIEVLNQEREFQKFLGIFRRE
jgi:hypothetical protein